MGSPEIADDLSVVGMSRAAGHAEQGRAAVSAHGLFIARCGDEQRRCHDKKALRSAATEQAASREGTMTRLQFVKALSAAALVMPLVTSHAAPQSIHQDQPAVGSATTLPLIGCYDRLYDASHLAAHRAQLVVRAMLSIKPAPPEMQTDKAHPAVATGDLMMWIRGRSERFDSLGACRVQGNRLLCLGSVSAAEADSCRRPGDGLRQCRIMPAGSSFQVEARATGVLVTIRERLEIVPAPYDSGPFLYFGPKNTDNRDFLLLKTTEDVCR
jgi:hypothetical protein